MELKRETWGKEDIIDFQKFLKSNETNRNRVWATNLLKTEMPILILSNDFVRNIVKEISKGNYLQFLDYMVWDYYENTAINGYLINLINDFDLMKKYLDIFSSRADNWATCDLLKFNVKGKEEKYLDLAKEYIKSEKTFVRRIGLNVLFNYINDTYIDEVLAILDLFYDEKEYYVNMINAWLLAECFIKQREKTLKYLEKNKLNNFTINKGIQKCRDSRRVSVEDKEMLLRYKKTSK